jgi:hypothetical protein
MLNIVSLVCRPVGSLQFVENGIAAAMIAAVTEGLSIAGGAVKKRAKERRDKN